MSAHARPNRPRDPNELAFALVAEATDENRQRSAELPQAPEKNPAAVALGRLGGLKGGKARAQLLTAEKRREIATNAALARWQASGESKK